MEHMSLLPGNCTQCGESRLAMFGRWEIGPGECLPSYEARLEYEREHGEGTVIAWPYVTCEGCGALGRASKKRRPGGRNHPSYEEPDAVG